VKCIPVHGEWHSDRITSRFPHTTSEDYETRSSYLTTREISNSLSTLPGYKLVLEVKGNKTHLAESSQTLVTVSNTEESFSLKLKSGYFLYIW
jgi:hypothetical protein